MKGIEGVVLFYNGVDRLKNKGGYTEKTVVPCCARCNQMKSDLSPETFLGHIILLYQNLIKGGA